MATTTHFTWDDFSGGELGDLSEHQAQNNMYSRSEDTDEPTNCLVYRNGEIGPRPGIETTGNTGLPNTAVGAADVHGAGYVAQGDSEGVHWLAIGDEVYTFDGSSTWTLATGNFSSSSSLVEISSVNTAKDKSYLLKETDGLYTLDVSGTDAIANNASFTTARGSDAVGRGLSVYRSRLYGVVGGNKILYSNANDFDTWSSSDFFLVGSTFDVVSLSWVQDKLVILTENLEVWEYRGVPGSDSLRRVHSGPWFPAIMGPRNTRVIANGNQVIIPPERDYPGTVINGAIQENLRLLAFDTSVHTNSGDGEVVVLPSHYQQDSVTVLKRTSIATEAFLLERRNGIWSTGKFSAVNLNAYASSNYNDRIIFNETVGGGNPPNIYSYDIEIQRPGTQGVGFSDSGDGTSTALTAGFSTPSIWSKDGSTFTIEQVVVDFTKVDSGSNNNSFSLSVRHMARGEKTDDIQVSFTAYDAGAAEEGRDRHIARGIAGGPASISGCQVNIKDIVGCTIRAITITLKSVDGSLMIQEP